MTDLDRDRVRGVVCHLLDCMRNAHLRMVLGDAERTLQFLDDADEAMSQLSDLFRGDAINQALAGEVLYEVIAERQASLRELVHQTTDHRMSSTAVVEFVEKPLRPQPLRAWQRRPDTARRDADLTRRGSLHPTAESVFCFMTPTSRERNILPCRAALARPTSTGDSTWQQLASRNTTLSRY
jgi:hypothetical protein